MNVTKNRKYGLIIYWITIFLDIVISLLYTPYLLENIGDRSYGLFSFATSISSWTTTLLTAVTGCYYKFVTREKAEKGVDGEKTCMGVFAIIYFIISTIMIIFGGIFIALLYSKVIPLNEYTNYEVNQICAILLISLISMTAVTILTVFRCFPFYKQQYIFIYLEKFIEIIVRTLISVIALFNGCDVVTLAFIHFGIGAIGTFAIAIYSLFALKQKISIKSANDEDKKYRYLLLKEIVFFSFFLLFNTIIELLNSSLDKILLGFYNADAVSFYQLAYSFVSYMISFTSIASIIFGQKLNNIFYDNDIDGANKVFEKSCKIQIIITALICGGFAVCGKEFISLWIGQERSNVYYYALALLLIYSFPSCVTLSSQFRNLQNKHKEASLIYMCLSLTNLIVSLILLILLPREFAIWSCIIGSLIATLIFSWVIIPKFDSSKCCIKYKNVYLFFTEEIGASFAAFLILHILKKSVFCSLNLILLFLLSGFIFVVIFTALQVLLFRKDIKELIIEFRSSSK